MPGVACDLLRVGVVQTFERDRPYGFFLLHGRLPDAEQHVVCLSLTTFAIPLVELTGADRCADPTVSRSRYAPGDGAPYRFDPTVHPNGCEQLRVASASAQT